MALQIQEKCAYQHHSSETLAAGVTDLSWLSGLISPGRVCVCCLLLHTGENIQVPSGTAKGSLPVAKRELGVMRESPEILLEVCQINTSGHWERGFWSQQNTGFCQAPGDESATMQLQILK